MEDDVLLHRLPVDSPALCSFPEEPACLKVETVKPVPVRLSLDILALLDLAGVAALTWAVQSTSAWPLGAGSADFLAGLAAALVAWLLAAQLAGLYSAARVIAGASLLGPACLACMIACLPLLMALAASAQSVAGLHTLLPAACALLLAWVCMTRLAWGLSLRAALRRGFCLQSAAVLATSVSAARILAAELERQTAGRTRVAVSAPFPGLPGGPSAEWVETTIHAHGIDRLLISGHAEFAGTASALLMRLRHIAADVRLVSDSGVVETAHAHGVPFRFAAPALDEPCNALTGAQAAGKRALDILVATAALIVAAPALLAIAIAVKFDSPGPVLFRQKRIGQHAKLFSIWKFRTMYEDMRDDHAHRQTGRDDPRVTRVGRFLRRTSLDELPQVVNVLRGDMSIVGPRPHALGMTVSGRRLTDLAAGYAARHRMRPGITGWAQVNGCRGEIHDARKLRRRIALDCHYIENWSFGLDFIIVLRTAALMVADRHAY
jgi:exopolysaccharide biosynthesis polyprenyl glycosylphosphotransferase